MCAHRTCRILKLPLLLCVASSQSAITLCHTAAGYGARPAALGALHTPLRLRPGYSILDPTCTLHGPSKGPGIAFIPSLCCVPGFTVMSASNLRIPGNQQSRCPRGARTVHRAILPLASLLTLPRHVLSGYRQTHGQTWPSPHLKGRLRLRAIRPPAPWGLLGLLSSGCYRP